MPSQGVRQVRRADVIGGRAGQAGRPGNWTFRPPINGSDSDERPLAVTGSR
jgi:hypothetical protein